MIPSLLKFSLLATIGFTSLLGVFFLLATPEAVLLSPLSFVWALAWSALAALIVATAYQGQYGQSLPKRACLLLLGCAVCIIPLIGAIASAANLQMIERSLAQIEEDGGAALVLLKPDSQLPPEFNDYLTFGIFFLPEHHPIAIYTNGGRGTTIWVSPQASQVLLQNPPVLATAEDPLDLPTPLYQAKAQIR